jgi:peptidoglycan/LPS O-acetylase OafA/YrhL
MPRRIEFLDGLRAIAVLSVVAFHTAAHNTSLLASASKPVLDVLRQGCHGVDLFFVISGFCLSYPVLLHARGGHPAPFFDICSFAARRVVRIVPPYYAAIGVLLILAASLTALHAPLPAGMPQHGFSAADVLRQGLFFDANVRFLNDVFWTLAVEFRWYFLFPIALWLWLRSPKAFGLIGIGAVFAAFATRAQSVDLAVLPTFMLGIAAAELYLRNYAVVRILALPVFAIALATAYVTGQTTYFEWSASPFWGLAAFCFVVAVGALRPLRALLSIKVLAGIGFASYGIYLIHEPFRGLIETAFRPYAEGWILWTAAGVCAVIVGVLFSFVAERPFVSTPLRARSIAALEDALGSLFDLAGISRRMRLPSTPEDPPVRAVA